MELSYWEQWRFAGLGVCLRGLKFAKYAGGS